MKRKTIKLIAIALASISTVMSSYASDATSGPGVSTTRYEDYVITAPGVRPEMESADYWLAKQVGPGKTLLGTNEVSAFSEDIRTSLIAAGEPVFDLAAVLDLRTPEELSAMLPGMGYPQTVYYRNGSAVGEEFWRPIVANMSGGSGRGQALPALCVRRSNLRIYPTDEILNGSAADLESDELQNSGILMNEPLAILYTTNDGTWYYACASFAAGWIKAADVALCRDLEEWRNAQNFTDFLVVTGDRFTLEEDPVQPEISELELFMGTKLELLKKDTYPPEIGRRAVYGNYVVRIPVRGGDGLLSYRYGLIGSSRDVSVGYLPYTTENVLKQAFKAYGDRYGWGGMYDSRDCSEYTMEVYRCFGIFLPRNSTTQSRIKTQKLSFDDTVSEAQRLAALDSVPPGSLLRFPGHVMIYLGKDQGEAYCISALGSFVPGDDGLVVRPRSVMANALSVKRASGKTWLSCITDVMIILPADRRA